MGDYPEQVLVTCTYNTRCPKCLVPPDQLRSFTSSPLRDYDKVRNVYHLSDGDAYMFHSACRKMEQKPVFHPFWELLPLTNIFLSITPDILHQLLQGVFKHLVAWLVDTFGPSEIDARCRAIPPNHHITLFVKGISWLSRVTGKEHKNMCNGLAPFVRLGPLRTLEVDQVPTLNATPSMLRGEAHPLPVTSSTQFRW